MEKRLNEIKERKAAILAEIDNADEARMAELETEVTSLEAEEREILAKLNLRNRLGEKIEKIQGRESGDEDSAEQRAKTFTESNHVRINTRALLLSGETIAQPTVVAGDIKDAYGADVSSIVDMVTVEDCTGMGTHRVPYVKSGLEAGEKKEGYAPTESDMEFDYIDLTPNAFNVLSYVSKQIKKQSPLMYENKVIKAARTALRKKASAKIIAAVYEQAVSDGMCAVKEYAKDAANGQKIGAGTLRDIVLSHGGDEGVGGGVLILNKTDLIAFGDVRGTNEKKAVYEITPDADNENTGTIRDGGLIVKYIINRNCEAFHGNKGAGKKTMIYGNPRNIEMDTWGEIDISTSEDYKFAEGLLSVLGETLLDVDVVVKNGMTVVTTGE